MGSVLVSRQDEIATITMARGKVNAVNPEMVTALAATCAELAADNSVSAVVLTGQGRFFSFGFDIPEMYDQPSEQFGKFIRSFCSLYRELFLFPKPVVAALNGHTIAGGCVLALACDYRILVSEGAKLSLNEVTFGSTLFAGAVEMLRYAVGNRIAERVLLSGQMFAAHESLDIHLVDELTATVDLQITALNKAAEMARHGGPAYTNSKYLIRRPMVDRWMKRENESIGNWLNIWYLPQTREKTKGILIR